MYIAPIEFDQVRYWFLNVNRKFDFLCMFLTGNGEYNNVINEEILRNRYLIDRATGDGICYFFCSSFQIEGDIVDFNRWNVRNREIKNTINDIFNEHHKSSSLQSELMREDVCDFYQISRSELPALVFINKKEDLHIYPIKGFKDIQALLTPLGIISDLMADKIRKDRNVKEMGLLKYKAKLKVMRYNELTKATEEAVAKSEYAQSLIDDIIKVCKIRNFDEFTLKKMYNHPEKIRQILSVHKIEDAELDQKILLLKDCISQYKIVTENRLSYFQSEKEKLSGVSYYEWDCDIKKEEEKFEKSKDVSIKNLGSLGLDVDAKSIIENCISGQTELWLLPILNASQQREDNDLNMADNAKILKCFIAGSKSLEKERDAIISGINDLNIQNKHTKKNIECYTYKHFDSYLTREGHQAAYNDFIYHQADLVIFALDEVIGGITKEEFMVAVDALRAKNYKSPIIFVFSNSNSENKMENLDISAVREQVDSLKQYWIDYSSLEVLKLKLQLKVNFLYTN